MTTARSEFFAGVHAQLPLLLGVIPFGLIYGALAIQLGVPASLAQAISSIVFAGAAQFVSAPLVATATPGIVIVFTVFIVNLRHALYSASLAPYLERLSPAWKMLLAYLLTDEAYAMAITHYQKDGDARFKHWFFFGTGLALWVCWQISTAIGIFVGAQVPSSWSLDFALPLTFIAIVMPMFKRRSHGLTAFVAGAAATLAMGLPYKIGLVLAVGLGIFAGMIAERGEG